MLLGISRAYTKRNFDSRPDDSRSSCWQTSCVGNLLQLSAARPPGLLACAGVTTEQAQPIPIATSPLYASLPPVHLPRKPALGGCPVCDQGNLSSQGLLATAIGNPFATTSGQTDRGASEKRCHNAGRQGAGKHLFACDLINNVERCILLGGANGMRDV